MFSTPNPNSANARTSSPTGQFRTFSCIATLLGASLLPFANATAAPGTCNGLAYLTQGHLSRTYAMDLVSGDYKIVAKYHKNQTPPPHAWTDQASLDALGFNANDNYVYGWSNFHGQIVRVHADWSVEPLDVIDLPKTRFYAGDISTAENRYYFYSRDKRAGLYYVELDPLHSDYLRAKLVVGSKILSSDLQDFAVHPTTGQLHAVEANGDVIGIDPNKGNKTVLGNAKVYSNFGASFFDDTGNLIIQRNHDGKVFRVGIDSGNYEAVFVVDGPSSSSNDGFRCATGSGTGTQANLADFGDAPDSYGTSLKSGGARHQVAAANPLSLGALVDSESDAYAFPLTDNDKGADEDGSVFVTTLVERQRARVVVKASGAGYLNVWVDIDRNGAFEPTDHLVIDKAVVAGSNMVSVLIPDNVNPGDTWARFRLSTSQGLEPTGLATDGEVEDHPVTLLSDPVTVSSYPSANKFSTIAFEDNWPFVGDYDMNDLVVRMRTRIHRDSQGLTQVNMEGYVTAVGAYYKNGFGIRLPGIPSDAIDEQNLEFHISDLAVAPSPLEPNRKEAIFIITDNLYKHVSPGVECDYYRTEKKCDSDPEFKFSLSVPFLSPQNVKLSGVFDPFLFATPGAYHGAHFVEPPGRSYEIHLKNQAPTEAFDVSLFAGVGQDASDASNGYYFQTATGMPWALEIGTQWRHPVGFTELSKAYPKFPGFATSNGARNKDWYMESNANQEPIYPE